MSYKGGFLCTFRGCSNRTGGTVSFFSFPKNPVRAKTWMDACNRQDLLTKTAEQLAKNYKLCEKHFEEKFIMKGKIRKNLTENAIPTIFVKEECIAIEVAPEEIAPNIITNFNASCETSTDFSKDENMSSFTETTEVPAVPVPGSGTQYYNSVSSKSIQTSAILSSHTPRKEKLRRKVRILCKSLRKEKETKKKKEWTKEDFFKMCDTFLPKALAEIVKAQVKQQDINRKKVF